MENIFSKIEKYLLFLFAQCCLLRESILVWILFEQEFSIYLFHQKFHFIHKNENFLSKWMDAGLLS
jgi:hypothetical protein